MEGGGAPKDGKPTEAVTVTKAEEPEKIGHIGSALGKKQMLEEMSDLKSYEAHDLDGDLVMSDPVPGGDDGLDVSSHLRNVLKERVAELKEEEFSLKPVIQFGFTLDELATLFLRWSQKDEDAELNKFNVDKAHRRFLEFGKFMAEYATELAEPLDEEESIALLELVGQKRSPSGKLERDGHGRAIMMASMKNLGVLEKSAMADIQKKRKLGTMHVEFLRAYTWSCFKLMKDPAVPRQGAVIIMDYAFMGMSDANTLQGIFGGKLKKSLGKLFHGTCPLKIKSIILLNAPWWMRMMMAFARMFVSGKIMSRMHILGEKHMKLAGYLGGPEYIPEAYFKCK